MAAFCLKPEFADLFKLALADGTIAPDKLTAMSSLKRREFLSKYVGEENAFDVNALFESKLILKDQQRGLATWARKVAGLSEPARRDLLTKIQRMDKVLDPASEDTFLGDLAQQRLGVAVTADEAKQIFDTSQTVQRALDAWKDVGMDSNAMDKRIAFGRAKMDLTELVESMKPGQDLWSWNTVGNVLGAEKSLLSTLDFSAPFSQGWGMMTTQRAWQGFGKMFQYFASPEGYKDLNAWIITHPDYKLAVEGKLGLTELGDKLSVREEAIQSNLVEQASHYLSSKTGVPDLVKGSARAYTGYLNYVRANRFFDLINAARVRGEDLSPGSRNIVDIANAVNDFTGRGNLGKGDRYAQAAPALNTMFFAPRKISATVNMFNPARYLDPRISKTARIAAFRQMTGSLAATGAVIGLARAMGADVDLDPTSTNFMSFGFGDTRFDLTGGSRVYVRLWARIIADQYKYAAAWANDMPMSNQFNPRDYVKEFFRNKLSPMAGFFADAYYHKDPVGRPFNITQEMSDKLVPMTIGSFIDFAANDPGNYAAIAPSLLTIFGGNMMTHAQREMNGLTVWGEPTDSFTHHVPTPVDQELKQLNYNMGFPQPTIQGVALNNTQYSDYIRIAGENAKVAIENDMSLPGWGDFPKEQKLRMIKADVTGARRDAADQLMAEDLNTAPEGQSIMDRATVIKNQQYGIAP